MSWLADKMVSHVGFFDTMAETDFILMYTKALKKSKVRKKEEQMLLARSGK